MSNLGCSVDRDSELTRLTQRMQDESRLGSRAGFFFDVPDTQSIAIASLAARHPGRIARSPTGNRYDNHPINRGVIHQD